MRMQLPILITFLITMILGMLYSGFSGPRTEVRNPAVAGQFYPADATKLKQAIRQFLDNAEKPVIREPLVLVVPHAGYVYSGQVAADAFRLVQGQSIDVVVILGTNHTSGGLRKAAVLARGAFRTPLGDVGVDEEVAAQLLKTSKDCIDDSEPHVREHSIEVQVPFIQQVLPGAKIVPIVVGSSEPAFSARLGEALAAALKGKRALIVASSDLSHYPPYAEACRVDKVTLEAIASMEPARLSAAAHARENARVSGLDTAACGEAPILAAMNAAKALGARRGVVISYANSGDIAVGDRSRVVGYGAVAFTREAAGETVAAPATSKQHDAGTLQVADKQYLLQLARETLHSYFSTETVPVPRHAEGALAEMRGAFVTLRVGGRLRGCIGRMSSDQPLPQTIAAVVLQSALEDSRFPPLSSRELPGVEIEISALTQSRPVPGPKSIRPGVDGVVLRKGGRSAVFLPQVATEQGWGVDMLLTQLCRKAGLPDSAWQEQGTQLMTFQAEVFSEAEFANKRE